MAWITYSTVGMPAAVTGHLQAAIPGAHNTLAKRHEAAPGEISVDWNGYVHHSAQLAAVLVEATVDALMTLRIWSNTRWVQTCQCMFRMDGNEKAVIAALAGEQAPGWPAKAHFNDALRRLIALPEIAPFFAVYGADDGTHYSVRPVGFEHDERDQLALFMEKKRIRAMEPGMRALLALITTAYSSDLAEDLFRGRGLALKTAEAAVTLCALPAEIRNDAMRLIAAYSGW